MSTINENEYIQLIRDRMGILLTHQQRKELPKVIHEACEKFKINEPSYFEKLKVCSNDSPLMEYLISEFTIGETYFFRDLKQIELLKNVVLPNIIAKKRLEKNKTIRIWSAGSSSGEEIYTIAILLRELIKDIDSWELHLLGTDINVTSLKAAMHGCYGDWSMRSIPEIYKTKYFKKMNKKYCLISEIKEMVSFDYLNLVSDSYPSIINGTNAQDLIICRNVLIYFDEEHNKLLIDKLSESLIPNGYLLLGASDPIFRAQKILKYHHESGSLFTKEEVNVEVNEIPLPIKKKPLKKVLPHVKPYVAPVKKMPQIHKEVELKETESLTETAMKYANIGNLDQAILLCKKSLDMEPTNKIAFFTMALILIELNKFTDAESALRKAIYLDPQFVMAHFQLGLLLLREKRQQAGMKSLSNAFAIAKTKNPDELVNTSQNLNYQKLTEILKNEIDLHFVGGGINHAK